jgi:hypothetical protein
MMMMDEETAFSRGINMDNGHQNLIANLREGLTCFSL